MTLRKVQFFAGVCAAVILAAAGMASAAAGGPTVVLSSTASSTTNLGSIPITATFSESVTGLASSSIEATNATIGSFSGSGSTYTFDLLPSSEGTTTVTIPADAATDASSTGNQASNTLTFDYDSVAPVIAQVSGVATTTSDATPSYTFSSSEAGTIDLSGGCTSSTTAATAGNNTITFNTLSAGSYSCSLSVTDAAGNVSNVLPIDFTEETAAPVISNVSVDVTSTSTADVMWTTDAGASSQVYYGTTSAYGSSSMLDNTSTTTHSVTLTGLDEATLYHYEVVSSDAGGTATSTDMEFVTSSTASTTPLAIDGIDTTQSSGIADNTFADGWQWVVHFTVPDNENAFRIRFSDWGNASSSFPTADDVQVYSPESSNASNSDSAILETDNGYSDWLYLTGDTGTTTPGRQIDLYVQVKIPFGTSNGSYSSDFTAQTYPSTATSTATQ